MPMSDIPADQHEAVEKAWKLLNLQAHTMLGSSGASSFGRSR
jgi:hypothetical protein